MKVNLIASNLLLLKYTGDSATKTLDVDGDGGTSAGLITLTDSSAHAFDLGTGSYDTVAELVAGINALDGWSCLAYGTAPVAGVFPERDISASGLFADVTALEIPCKYQAVIPFASATETVANGVTSGDITQAVPVQIRGDRNGKITVEVAVTPNASSASGDVTVYMGRSAGPLQSADGTYPVVALADFNTQEFDSIAVSAPATAVRVSEIIEIEVGSAEFFAPLEVSNASGQECEVEVNILR